MLYFLIILIACLSYLLGRQAQKNKNNEKINGKDYINSSTDIIDVLQKHKF